MSASAAAQLIERYYSAFNRGDMHGFLALLTDDVEHEINQGGVEIGKAAFARFMERMNLHYREQVLDLVIMTEAKGQRVAAEFNVQGTYLKTDPGLPEARGQTYLLPVGAFFTIRDGKVARVSNYYNLQTWLKMVH